MIDSMAFHKQALREAYQKLSVAELDDLLHQVGWCESLAALIKDVLKEKLK